MNKHRKKPRLSEREYYSFLEYFRKELLKKETS